LSVSLKPGMCFDTAVVAIVDVLLLVFAFAA
jgi:hypothetical protein